MQDEQQRCGSCYIDKTSIQAASVVLHISLPATLDSLVCSQVRHSVRSCTIFHALPQWIISLHVFEDDTVAKVTVSKANLNVFFLLGPAPFFVASLFCFEAKRKSGWGICGSFLVLWFCCFLFVFGFVMICQSFWTTRVLVHYCVSLLTQL